jgi:hypothetical protein
MEKDWMQEAQNYTLITATKTNEEWTHEEIRKLETLRALKLSIRDIAVKLNRSYYSVSTKMVQIGLVNSHKKSNSKKSSIVVCGVCFIVPSKTGVCFC